MHTGTCLFRSTACQTILSDIRQYLEDADRIFKRRERFDQDRRDFYARAMVLFALSNRIIDLAREVSLIRGYISDDEQVKNKVYFKRLNDHGVISWDMRQEMITLVNFRNQVSHHFYEITRDEIEKIYLARPVILEFITIMEKELAITTQEKTRTAMIAGVALVVLIVLLCWYFS